MKQSSRKKQLKQSLDKTIDTGKEKNKKREATPPPSVFWRNNLHLYAPFL